MFLIYTGGFRISSELIVFLILNRKLLLFLCVIHKGNKG